ncbi:MAG: hypothetical protein H7203_05265 [Rhizobacter sp.]|nr:hypothetical protein [Burkholderiales bacterium]
MLQIFSHPAGGRRTGALLAVTLLFTAYASHAQVVHGHSPASPLAANAVAGSMATPTDAPLAFESTLSRYKSMTDQKLGSWREANDTVMKVGGWRSYLKESQAPDATTTPAQTPPLTPAIPAAPNPHAGHGAKP